MPKRSTVSFHSMISIIVPVYNAENFIKRCVDSVLKQTYSDWELILVNDGSTDGSAEICLYYQRNDKRIRFFDKKNEGPGPTRLFGVNQARGEYVFFIDSDDYISENALDVLLKSFDVDTDCVIGQHHRFGEIPDIKQITFKQGEFDFQIKEKEQLVRFLFDAGRQGGLELWNKLFRKSVIENACSEPIRLMYGEDILLTISIFLRCRKVSFINDITYFYEFKEISLARNTASRKELPFFANELSRLENFICKTDTDRSIYSLIVYKILTIPLGRYRITVKDDYELLIKDVILLNDNENVRRYAEYFLKNRKRLRKKYSIDKYDLNLATYLYKTILKNDIWYYARLYPAMIEKHKLHHIVKAYIKRFLKNEKRK